MEDVNEVIAKLIIAGAVKLDGKAPVFTKEFVGYATFAFAKNPAMDESATGWRDMFTGFHVSLASLDLRELAILSAIVSFMLAIEETPIA